MYHACIGAYWGTGHRVWPNNQLHGYSVAYREGLWVGVKVEGLSSKKSKTAVKKRPL